MAGWRRNEEKRKDCGWLVRGGEIFVEPFPGKSRGHFLDQIRIRGREMRYKIRDIFNPKVIIGSIAVAAGCVTILSFVLSEKRRPDEMRKDEVRAESITSAISEMIEATRESNSNEGARIQVLEKTTEVLKSKPTNSQMWSASVRVSGAKNVISFVASSENEKVPREVGGTKSNKVVPIPKNCQLTIQVSGAKNKILIDEKLRRHVSVSGVGAGCSVSWISFDK